MDKYLLPNFFVTTLLPVIIYLLFPVPDVRGQEPTNPAAATVHEHIILTPDEIEWGEYSAAIPPGAASALI